MAWTVRSGKSRRRPPRRNPQGRGCGRPSAALNARLSSSGTSPSVVSAHDAAEEEDASSAEKKKITRRILSSSPGGTRGGRGAPLEQEQLRHGRRRPREQEQLLRGPPLPWSPPAGSRASLTRRRPSAVTTIRWGGALPIWERRRRGLRSGGANAEGERLGAEAEQWGRGVAEIGRASCRERVYLFV